LTEASMVEGASISASSAMMASFRRPIYVGPEDMPVQRG
jgi:hypothetical protein